MTPGLLIGAGTRGPVLAPWNRLNRHALVTGATGTGKTTTIGGLCERLAAAGVPVLAMDAKGDLEGLARDGGGVVWCPFGERGTARPLDLELIGPETVARALDLSEAQSGALYVAFTMARAESLDLHSLDDLRDVLHIAINDARRVSAQYGLVSPASAAAVSRALMRLEYACPGAFGISPARRRLCPFEAGRAEGEPARVTVLSAARLTHAPGLYGATAAYLLGALFERAPEIGDPARPALVVMIDESHLLFDGAPPALVRRIEQVVRLIRSKGIGLIFATQSPADLPPGVAGQLQTRIQHGLRAVTAAQAKGVRAAAETMPAAPGVDLVDAIGRLGIGQALVSVPGPGGAGTPADVVKVARCRADLSPLAADELQLDPPVSFSPARPHFSDPAPVVVLEVAQVAPGFRLRWFHYVAAALAFFWAVGFFAG